MQIRSVQLLNIKSCESLTVSFTPGVNAITGHNGAGKSTLLEAIGYAIFGAFDYSKSEFIKEGESGGKVTVVFSNPADGRDYLVERAVGSSSLWLVEDRESGVTLVKGKADVVRWMAHMLAPGEDVNLANLFVDALGVAQGTLTAAFLQPTERRRAVFNPLLRVEEYRKAYDALRETNSHLEGLSHQAEVGAAELQGRVAGLPDLRRAAADLENRLVERGAMLATRRAALETAAAELQEHETRKAAADAAAQALRLAQFSVARSGSAVEQATTAVERAQAAAEVVRAQMPGHDSHLQAQEARTALEARQRERLALLSAQAAAGQAHAGAGTRVESLRQQMESIAAAEARAEALRAPAERQVALKAQLDAANQEAAAHQSARRLFESLGLQLTARRGRQNEMAAQVQQSLLLAGRLHGVERSLGESDALLGRLREELGGLRAAGDAVNAHTRELEGLAEPLCPVCRKPLEAAARARLLQEDAQRVAALRDEYRSAREAKESAEAQRTEFLRQQTVLLEEMRGLATESQVATVAREVADLARQHEEAARAIESQQDAPMRVAQLAAALRELGEPATERAGALAQAAHKAQIERDLADAGLEVDFQAERLQEIAAQLAPFSTIEAELEQVDAQLAGTRDAYTQVLGHRALAAGLPAAAAELEAHRSELTLAQKSCAAAEVAAAQAGAAWSAGAHELAQQAANDLRSAVGGLTSELAMLNKEKGRYAEDIARLERDEARLATLLLELQRLGQRARTLDKMRKVIREAGPRITALRIGRISALADEIYRDLTNDYSARLIWDEEYALSLEVNGLSRPFRALSGGEQMTAALAVRLALLREMSGLKLAFFDEPTANLDPSRRERLAAQIASIQGFEQIIVISHDDTFESATANVIRLEKQNGATVLLP